MFRNARWGVSALVLLLGRLCLGGPVALAQEASAQEPVPAPAPGPTQAVEIIIDDASDECFATEGDTWRIGAEFDSYDERSHWSRPEQEMTVKAVWTPDLPVGGEYEVFLWIGSDSAGDHASDAPYKVQPAGDPVTVKVDLADPKLWGKWNSIGVYRFDRGRGGSVTLTANADGNVVADAVRFLLREPAAGR